MQQGYTCVAGVNVDRYQHVRPVLPGARLPVRLLARNGGPFDMAAVVDLGATRHMPDPPEVEDHQFNPAEAKRVSSLTADEFWDMLRQIASESLAEIFGPELKQRGSQSAAVDVHSGRASLGCLIPRASHSIYLSPRANRPAQVRLKLSDGQFNLDLGVTDIRLYGADHVTADSQLVSDLDRRLARRVPVILSVGLTRPIASSPEYDPVHWLQVNNLHLQDQPRWELG